MRKIENGSLISQTAAFESSVTNSLYFKEPGPIYYMEAKVKVNSVEGDLIQPGATAYSSPFAGFAGAFYNDGTGGGENGRKGDVVAQIRVQPHESGALQVRWYVSKSADASGSSWTTMAQGSFSTSVQVEEWHLLGVGFNPTNHVFTFILDGESQSWTSEDTSFNPPVNASKPLRTDVRFYGASTGLYGKISAEFDDVVAKDSSGDILVSDDFTSSVIDPSKWSSYEYVRSISDGKLLSELRSLGAAISNNLSFRNPENILCIGGKVSLTDFFLLDPGQSVSRRARVGGYFFNTTGDPNSGYQGDVWAEVYLGGSGSQPRAEWAVWEATNSEGTTSTQLGFGRFPLSVNLGESYDLFIGWDGSSFTFLCNQYAARYSPEGPFHNPNHNVRLLGTRIPALSSGASFDASITATFDDITINECPNAYSLSVSTSGSGAGTIASSPQGILCGDRCIQEYKESTVVSLTATPNQGSVFAGWSGDCSSCGTNTACEITLDANKTCTAAFSPPSGPDLTGGWVSLTQRCKNTRAGLKCKLKGALRVENQGNLAAAPGAFVSFYLSSDSSWDSEDTFLKQVAVGALKAGRSKTRKLNVTLPIGETAQGKYGIAWIDATDALEELNESNNIVVSTQIP